MDSVVVLDNGSITDVDSYEHVRLRSMTLMEKAAALVGHDSEYVNVDAPQTSDDMPLANDEQAAALETDTLQRRGGSWSVYSYYGRSASVMSLVLWVVFTFMGAVTASYTSMFLITFRSVGQDAYSLYSNMDSTVDNGK